MKSFKYMELISYEIFCCQYVENFSFLTVYSKSLKESMVTVCLVRRCIYLFICSFGGVFIFTLYVSFLKRLN